jgi:hypothetical protein
MILATISIIQFDINFISAVKVAKLIHKILLELPAGFLHFINVN